MTSAFQIDGEYSSVELIRSAYSCTLANMGFIWDPEKARRNALKHGVRFADAALVLDDPYALTIRDSGTEAGEERWVTMGADAQGRV